MIENIENMGYFLKNCPFCGMPAKIITNELDGAYDICCKTTGCFLEYGADWRYGKEELNKLVDKWNKRTTL